MTRIPAHLHGHNVAGAPLPRQVHLSELALAQATADLEVIERPPPPPVAPALVGVARADAGNTGVSQGLYLSFSGPWVHAHGE